MAPVLHGLNEFYRRRPLLVIWGVGLLLRWVTAVFAIGFFARDDYFHVLDISLAWIADPAFDWESSERAGAGIRSHLLPRIVQGALLGAEGIGITSPVGQLRAVYLLMGTYASLVIPGMWRLMDDRSPRAQILATWLAAAHFILPYAGTRLLIEAAALPPLVWGLALVRRDEREWDVLLGGFLIGLACWWRYQVGVMGLAVVFVLVFRRRWRPVGLLALGAMLAVSAQGVFDLATFGEFLGPVRGNIAANLEPHDALTDSSPFAYLGLWIALTLPPLTVWIVPLLYRAARTLPLVSVPWLAFVLFHSLVPHKEERFMLPALPLFLALLALTPDLLDSARGRFFAWGRRLRRVGFLAFVGVHSLALLIASGAQTQANARRAMEELRVDAQANAVVSMGPELQLFFLDRPELPTARTGRPDLVWLGRVLAEFQRDHERLPNRYLCFEPECGTMELMLASLALSCETPQVFPGFWADRLAYALNPEHNRRRASVWLYRCDRPSLARAMSHEVSQSVTRIGTTPRARRR